MKPPVVNVPFINLSGQHQPLIPELLSATQQVLSHGQFILGPEVATFEEQFTRFCGVRYAVGVDNGTNALLLSLRTLGVGTGDEVITAANSFFASASSIALTGATPVLVDVLDDFTIDPELVERAITPRTKAIMPVHLTGCPANMAALCDIAERHDIPIVEDAAQAVGAISQGKRVGSFGKTGCFSLHPLKILNAVGDGGVITTNDPSIYEKLIKARNHGLRNRDECEFWSMNARLDTLQAAMLLVKLKYLEEWILSRRKIAAFYQEQLKDVVTVPEKRSGDQSVYQTFVIQCEHRNELQAYLTTRNIDTKVHYSVPIHLQPAAQYLGYHTGTFPVTERLASSILSLPIYPELGTEQLENVVCAIRGFYGAN